VVKSGRNVCEVEWPKTVVSAGRLSGSSELHAVDEIVKFKAHVEFHALMNSDLLTQNHFEVVDVRSAEVIAAPLRPRLPAEPKGGMENRAIEGPVCVRGSELGGMVKPVFKFGRETRRLCSVSSGVKISNGYVLCQVLFALYSPEK
jgi:hypothetical protein